MAQHARHNLEAEAAYTAEQHDTASLPKFMAQPDGQTHPFLWYSVPQPPHRGASSDAAADATTAQASSASCSSLLTPLLRALHRASASSCASSCWRTSCRRHHHHQQRLQLQLVLQTPAAAGRTPLGQILLPWWPSPWPADLQLPAAAELRVLVPAASAVVACAAAAGHLLPAAGLLQHALLAAGLPGGPEAHHTGQDGLEGVPAAQQCTQQQQRNTAATTQHSNKRTKKSSSHVHHILPKCPKRGRLHDNVDQLWQVSDKHTAVMGCCMGCTAATPAEGQPCRVGGPWQEQVFTCWWCGGPWWWPPALCPG